MYQPRWYQEECEDAFFDYFDSHPEPGNPLFALPTGTGKSVVIARTVKRALMTYPSTRVMMLTHVKELIEQNASKLQEIWPLAPLGVYSAGLNARDMIQPVIFGGVKSVVKNIESFGWRDLLFVDECHLIPGEGDSADYLKVIEGLKKTNPKLKVAGYSATIYRMGLGLLTNGKIFDHVAYDLTNVDGFNRLLAERYICPLIPPARMPNGEALVEIDTTNVGMTKGEFNPTQAEEEADKISYPMLKQAVELGWNRHSWAVFASGVKHAEHLGELLNSAFGIPTVVIHSKKSDAENAAALMAWKTGQVRCAVSMNSLTTGVDHPPLDFIVVGRATMSTGLWVQMLGRGTRPYDYRTERNPVVARAFPYVKENCLVADFAGNTRRLGPINDPVIPRQKGKGPPGDAPVRICDVCGVYNHASARHCVACGSEFSFDPKLNKQAGTDALIRSDLPQIEPFHVSRQVLVPHVSKTSGRASIKVCYYTSDGLRTFYEYISFETSGVWFKKSRDWLRQRYGEPWEGMTNGDVLNLAPNMRHPRVINVWINKAMPEIVSHEF